MLTADLVRLYPRLYHMAADGSWASIEKHGLLSTAALMDTWEISEPGIRSLLLEQRREDSRVIEHPVHGYAIVRDQKPIHEPSLAAALDGMTVTEWLRLLNERVFFFLQEQRLSGMLNAKSYRHDVHTVVTVDTASLVAAYEGDVYLSPINSGFIQRHTPGRRGRHTFKSVADYSHPEREQPKEKGYDIAELSIIGGVPDIRDHVVRVDRMLGDIVRERLL